MTNSDKGFVLGKHLEEANTKTKSYVLQELLTLSQAVASDIANLQTSGNVLDTVPATVNGGLWYEIEDSAPVIKIFYNNGHYKITPVALRTPTLSVNPSTITANKGDNRTTTITYDGDGVLYVSHNVEGVTTSITSQTLSISVSNQAPSGAYTLTVGANAGATCRPVSIEVPLIIY